MLCSVLAGIVVSIHAAAGCSHPAIARRPAARQRASKIMTSLVVIPTRRAHSNHAEVARSIGVDIIAGRYAEGMRLPGDAELTAMFGVSRPVLRESVKTLVAKGLLSTKARVGTVVRERGAWNMFDADVLAWHLDAGIDKRFLGDLAEIRLVVEPRAAALAAVRRSEDDIAELRQSMDRMRREASDSVGFADADLALHIAVANASGNPFMRSIGNVIEAALRASFLLSAPTEPQDRETVLRWHQRIVDAIADGDAEAAAAAIIEVIHNGMSRHDGPVAAPAPSQTLRNTNHDSVACRHRRLRQDRARSARSRHRGDRWRDACRRRQPQRLAAGPAAFHDAGGVVARRSADRCRCSLHAAAGAARAGGGGARGRQACDAGKAAGRERQRTRSPDCGGGACRADAVRDLAFALCARGRAGAAMACGVPHPFRAHQLEGGRSRLASGAGLDLGAGRAWRLRSRHQRALDPHQNPAAAAVRDGRRAFFPGQSRGADCGAPFADGCRRSSRSQPNSTSARPARRAGTSSSIPTAVR